jgi:hypothetical protein
MEGHMRFELDDYTRGLSDEKLLADLRRVAGILHKDAVTIDEYRDHGRCHPSTIQRRFGSWFAALHQAGLKRTRVLGITDDELFGNLENVWIKLGRQPSYGEVKAPVSLYSAGTYEKRFGTWRKALEAFVEYANAGREDGEAEVEDEQALPEEIRHSTRRSVSLRLRFLVFRRDSFKCAICGKTPAANPGIELVVDHVTPWSKGGETRLENLQTLCVECNSGKSNLSMGG